MPSPSSTKPKVSALGSFIVIVWLMVLAVAAFLATVVPEIDTLLGRSHLDRTVISAAQAAIAITTVVLLILALSIMKEVYIGRKLR